MNRRRFNVLRRQKNMDYECSQRRSEDTGGYMQTCTTTWKTHEHKANFSMIKMAAINDDEDTIMCILNNAETNNNSGKMSIKVCGEKRQRLGPIKWFDASLSSNYIFTALLYTAELLFLLYAVLTQHSRREDVIFTTFLVLRFILT